MFKRAILIYISKITKIVNKNNNKFLNNKNNIIKEINIVKNWKFGIKYTKLIELIWDYEE